MNAKSVCKILRCSFFIALIYTLLSSTPAIAWPGKVVGVSDGDTIKVLNNGTQENIRLYGVDCPEKNQAFGRRATAFTATLVAGKTVEVTPVSIDKYGRTIAWVHFKDTCVNEELLKSGMAWHYKKYSNESRLASMENLARGSRSGLWNDPAPTAPWAFRNNKNSKQLIAVAGTVYHGNVNSLKFHRPGCQHYNCKNCTAVFKSRDEAISAGYQPCGICKP